MRITMKSLCALPTGALEPGRTYDVSTARARSLVAGGYAVPADEDPAAGRKRKPSRKKTQRKQAAKSVGGADEVPPEPDENPDDLDEEAGDGSEEDDAEGSVDLSSMSIRELRSLARDRGVDAAGKKADLIERLAADAKGDGDDTESDDVDEDDED